MADLARQGTDVKRGPSAADIVAEGIDASSILSGRGGTPPAAPNAVQQGSPSEITGAPGSSLIAAGGTAEQAFGQGQQQVSASAQSRPVAETRRREAREDTSTQIRQNESPSGAERDRPMFTPPPSSSMLFSAPSTMQSTERVQDEASKPTPDGRPLMRPQEQQASASFSADDFLLSEEDRNPNNADINIETPPVVEPIKPVEVSAGEGFKHAKATPVRKVSMEETVEMVNRRYANSSQANPLAEDEENVLPQPDPPRKQSRLVPKDVPGSTFYREQREEKSRTTSSVADKNWTGNGFTEKVIASRDVWPEDVSIGSRVIAELIREPGNNLIKLVNEQTGLNFTVEQLLEPDGMNSFLNAINQATIYAIASKSPIPNPSSAQKRRLRVHYGRGVKVHPTQTKIYNLDFDGDGVSIQLETDGSLFRGAMDYLINEMGAPMIDLDFFPVAQIVESRNDFISKFRDVFLTRISEDVDSDKLAGAIYDVMYPDLVPGDRDKNQLLVDCIHAMDEVASHYSNKGTVLSYILKDLFDNMLTAKQLQVANQVEVENDRLIDIIEPVDNYITMLIDDISYGNLPPNFQDFLIGLGRYVGEIDKKNVMFRLGADVAKRINFSGVTFKGEEGARELYALTLEAGMAAFMSGRATIGEKTAYIQQTARNYIISRVRFPNSTRDDGSPMYRNFTEWLKAFVRAYNYFQGLVDLSQVEFGCDLDPVYSSMKDRKIDSDKLVDLATPIKTIYGNYVVEKVFPNVFSYAEKLTRHTSDLGDVPTHMKGNTLLNRYKNMRLSDLAMNNRIKVEYNKLKNVTIDQATPQELLLAIADKRRSTSSKFSKDLSELMENYAKGFSDFAKHHRRRNSNRADFMAYANDLMSCFHMVGPDMYAYYGMNDPGQFINSYYGNLMQKAANKKKDQADYMGGVRISMIIQYRMRIVQDINAEINRLIEEGELLYTIPRINELQNRLVDELTILGSSSDLWAVLEQEVNGNSWAFDKLVKSKGKALGTWCNAKDFWKRGHKKYKNLMDVMIDPSLPRSRKEDIAADVVKMFTGFYEFMSHEMGYQLEIGPHSNYTNISTMAYRDQPDVLSDITEANNKFKMFFKKNWKKVQDDVIKAEEQAQAGDLDSYLRDLAENPELYMEVPDDLIVDAVNAQMDKSSRASEKAHQEIPVNALYNALAQQKGGLTNAMYRSDARTLGMISEDSLTPFDIIRVLANPEHSVVVYNGDHRYTLSREALCGDNSEKALWAMLKKNPRIAAMIRPSVATVSKENIYRNAKQGFLESFRQPRSSKDVLRGKVKAELTDRPMFLAMVAMFKPIHGRHSRSLRQETKDVMNSLQTIMIGLGKRVADGDPIDAGNILNIMGVSVESLQESGGMDEAAAENWYNQMSSALTRYLSDVASIIKEGGYQSDARAIFNERANINLRFDASSVDLAVDVHQTMTGAKTETSTGVEGAMSQDNLGLALWAMSAKDKFTVIDGNMSEEELAPFKGCMTNAGVFDGTNIEDLEWRLGFDTPVVVQMPEEMVRQDPTLDDSEDFQIPSIARFAIIKRTKSAEDHNLKAKKSGDDGLDSITKVFRYDPNAQSNIDVVGMIYRKFGLFSAIIKLAQILQNADAVEGYKDLDLADYANIASMMIKEIDDGAGNSTIVIRSIGELSMAIRRNMDQDVVEKGTPGEKIENAAQIAEDVGIDSLIQTEFLTDAALFAASSLSNSPALGGFRPAKNAAMSSPDRSFNMLWKVTNHETLKLPWGGTHEKKSARFMTSSEIRKAQTSIRSKLPFDISKSNFDFIGIVGYNGKNGDRVETNISPGHLSVWYLTSDATQEEINMALRECYAYGMTLAFDDLSSLGDMAEFFAEDITAAPFGDDMVMLPFFDMRMNRSAISGPMAPASFQFDPSWVWYSVEDSQNLYGLGDAESLLDESMIDEVQAKAGDILRMDCDDLFFNTRRRYPDQVGLPELCDKQEIENLIVNWQDGGPTIDFGITDANPNYNNMTKKLGLQLEEYRKNFSQADEHGFLPEGKPDRILGWVKCRVGNYPKPVYAPIIPWQTGVTGSNIPSSFTTSGNYAFDYATNSFAIGWTLSEDLDGHYCKVHDGMGGAGKTMIMFQRGIKLGKLRNGRQINQVTAAESFASRRLAWGKRMCTLKTLAMTMALPPYGYNYAEHDAAFPDNPDIKKDLATRRIPLEEWPTIMHRIKRFSADPEVDSLLREMVELALQVGTNPSDILATKYGNSYTFMYVDYDFFFDTNINFQNALMKWYNSMQPDVCPPSIDEYYNREDGKGYLFKPLLSSDEYERGCLQMSVPHKHPITGNIFWRWENVYASFSFFNDDNSALHKVGLNGASRTMEQLIAMAISGKWLDGRNMQLYTQNAASPSFRTSGPYDIELDYGKFLAKER